MSAPKALAALAAALCLLAACAAPEQAPEPDPAPKNPSSVSAPASPEPEPPVPPSPESAPEPDQRPRPPQGEVNPDFGMGAPEADSSTGPVNPLEDETLGPALKQEEALKNAVDVFFLEAPEEAYSYQRVELTGSGKLRLEVGVLDDAALDRFLAGYTGEPWDELVKKPGLYSVAIQNRFLKAVRLLEPEPGVHLDAYFLAAFDEERFTIDLSFDEPISSPEAADRWSQLPQEVKDLAAELGIREEALEYLPPQYTPSGDHPD